jgi:hypothetical protein
VANRQLVAVADVEAGHELEPLEPGAVVAARLQAGGAKRPAM